ncbi:hypothetical protein C6P41_001352 [Kluyveromyces marxianus]|nr:hypothetical protein C6P41_001352 [Kluyveromyces marxianus]
MGINNPIPSSLKSETKYVKAAKVLASFVKPNQVLSANDVIPPHVLKDAKGLAVITVLKAGFLFSGRAGSGVIVARLPDGGWSAPSAIALAGAGAGGMIGLELTDFVFILNSADAVKSFSQFGSITLGGNVSVAAGPLGRNAEAAASASTAGIAAVFAYSKTKGLFAGVSLEGSVILERREANRKFYAPVDDYDDDYYNDIPSSFDSDDIDSTRANTRSTRRRADSYRSTTSDDSADYRYDDEDVDRYSSHGARRTGPASNSRWEDEVYDLNDRFERTSINTRNSRGAPSRPRSEKPDFSSSAYSRTSPRTPSSHDLAPDRSSGAPKAVALYTFKGEQPGDLPFRKGDVITIIKKSESQDDWWTGRVNGKEGIFPANYVELV